ncbi:MAG: fatty acid desaturase [Candidatus Hydrogenedentes bacterium]|nr:fatty acid desaturase [Candidatus Hydrogenedentota bacterium]
MGALPDKVQIRTIQRSLHQSVLKYGRPNMKKALGQLLDTLVPYLLLWAIMIYLSKAGYSYWIILTLTVVAAVLLVRTFIVFHDCCHCSFLASRTANHVLGYALSVLVFTPYDDWRRAHVIHHATTGDLDQRGLGDVWTMTVDEYLAAPRLTRLQYRLARNPLVIFGLGPLFMFLIAQRYCNKGSRRRERVSVIFTNLALIAVVTIACLTIGAKTYLLIQLPITFVSGAAGLWLFYIQHQFTGVYWARHETWDPIRAALIGSSYYRLPKVLQWCTGNIGLHHIHHAYPGVPNYNLQRCLDETPDLHVVEPLTIRGSLESLRLNLWDEKTQTMVSFRTLRDLVRTTC